MNITLSYSSLDPADFRKKIEQNNKYSPVSKKKSPLAWLKDHVSGIDLGEHFPDSTHPVHCNKNKRVIEHFSASAEKQRSFLSYQWNWAKVSDHCAGLRRCYFAGASESKKRFSLGLIDVDCKRFGTPEGARKYLEFVRENVFPNLYIETSTNGRGGHGYFLLDKCGLGSKVLNDLLLKRLAPWLNELAQDFDVEFVEIKGTLPVFEWGDKKFEVLDYKAGTLAKVPVDLVDRFQELKNTTKITAYDLMKLPDPEVPEKVSVRKMATEQKTTPSVAGSIAGKHFDEETLAGLQEGGRFRIVAESLMTVHELRTSGRTVVTLEDVAIALMIGEWLTNNMPTNGAMPTKRWTGYWTSLAEAGDIERAWDNKRFAVIRNFLSSLGLIEWEDESYQIGWYKDDGSYVKGKAAKWRFSAELMEKLAEAGDVEGVSADAEGVSDNKEREKRHPLWEQEAHLIALWSQQLIQQPENAVIRPIETTPQRVELIDPEELMTIIGYFEAVAA